VTHHDLVNRLLLAVSPLGLAWSNNTGALKAEGRMIRYGLVGSSDILMIKRPTGRLFAIEAKVGRDAWRKPQQAFARAAEAAGAVYILARSTDGTGDDAVSHVLEIINGR
jgi:outer membrane protein assembly factor BamB